MEEPTKVLLKAIRDACKQDKVFDGFFKGYFGVYPIEQVVSILDKNTNAIAVFLNCVYASINEYDKRTPANVVDIETAEKVEFVVGNTQDEALKFMSDGSIESPDGAVIKLSEIKKKVEKDALKESKQPEEGEKGKEEGCGCNE